MIMMFGVFTKNGIENKRGIRGADMPGGKPNKFFFKKDQGIFSS
jgi:hypothetical protein